jgi:cystathionine beta-lyase
MKPATRLVRYDAAPEDPWRPLSTPIYQTACFAQPSASELGPYDYTRSGNPTRAVLERELAGLEGAERAAVFASGMAALVAVTRLVPRGRIVAGEDLYGGSHRLLTQLCVPQGIEVDFVDATDLAALARALETPAGLVLLETPTNPLLRVADVARAAELCRAHGALLCIDGSLTTPLRQRPLELGADLVVHSATKFLCGHGDVTAGVVATRDGELARRLAFVQNAEGTGLAPFESWLLLRGLKTLALRLDAAERNARRIARFLERHPLVERVHYPGLASHPGRALHARQASGPGAVLSFETGSLERSCRLVDELRLFTIAVSFGSVASQASLPCRMSHASIPAATRAARGLPEDLVRLSVGIEDAGDLVGDLEQALRRSAGDADGTERRLRPTLGASA